MDDNELLRRCSLQEYSMVKQQQLQQQQNTNSKRKSVSKITELMPQSSVDSGCNNPKIKEQSRRMSTNPQDYLNGSGILTEPGSPAKPGKLLGKWKRRCGSVDAKVRMMNHSRSLQFHISPWFQAGRPAPLLRRCSVPVFGKNPCKFRVLIYAQAQRSNVNCEPPVQHSIHSSINQIGMDLEWARSTMCVAHDHQQKFM